MADGGDSEPTGSDGSIAPIAPMSGVRTGNTTDQATMRSRAAIHVPWRRTRPCDGSRMLSNQKVMRRKKKERGAQAGFIEGSYMALAST